MFKQHWTQLRTGVDSYGVADQMKCVCVFNDNEQEPCMHALAVDRMKTGVKSKHDHDHY